MMSTRIIYIFLCLSSGWQAAVAQEERLRIGPAYTAKTICSGVFLSGRSVEDIVANDISRSRMGSAEITVDRAAQSVTATTDSISVTAIFRESCGCTIVSGTTEEKLRAQPIGTLNRGPALSVGTLWPAGQAKADAIGIDKIALNAALDYAMDEPYTDKKRGTRGLVIVHNGRLVAERYADGFSAQSPLICWSMTKTITNALIGMQVKAGAVKIYHPAPVPEWSDEDDERHAITTDQLLRMSSGLEFSEVYGAAASDVILMLFAKDDAAAFTASKKLEHPIDTHWAYSSGTSNVLSRIVKDSIGGDLEDYIQYPYNELFNKLGMLHTTLETDASGVFVGSSFMYSTPRDLARIGQFFLQDGVWNGDRILPEGWIQYSTTPTPDAPRGQYDAQFWLNAGEPDDRSDRRWPDVPADAFWLSGFNGQVVMSIPSRDVVIARLGHTSDMSAWDTNHFVAEVLKSLPVDTNRADVGKIR
jgi:CubicO group peptidase (beta-lactamase class C family)